MFTRLTLIGWYFMAVGFFVLIKANSTRWIIDKVWSFSPWFSSCVIRHYIFSHYPLCSEKTLDKSPVPFNIVTMNDPLKEWNKKFKGKDLYHCWLNTNRRNSSHHNRTNYFQHFILFSGDTVYPSTWTCQLKELGCLCGGQQMVRL